MPQKFQYSDADKFGYSFLRSFRIPITAKALCCVIFRGFLTSNTGFFFISNDFISNTRLKLAYFLAIFKQHLQAENRVLEEICIEID